MYPAITDAELKTLNDAGVRGIRFSLTAPDGTSPAIPAAARDVIETLSRRRDAIGWHIQFNIDANQIVAIADVLNRLPSRIVFDHMGHMPPGGTAHPAFAVCAGSSTRAAPG